MTAAGTTVKVGVIASDYIPRWTNLRFERSFRGKHWFQVQDTGAPFDVWVPCDGSPRWVPTVLHFRRQIN